MNLRKLDDLVQIRKATLQDVHQLSSMIRLGFRDVAERFGLTPDNCPNHPSNCTERWIEEDLGRGVVYYILERSRVPTGCVALECAENGTFYLERLTVLPEARRRSFGKTLVDHAFMEAKALGAERIDIGIIAEHIELKNWYEKMGFVETETRKFENLPFLVTLLTYDLVKAERPS